MAPALMRPRPGASSPIALLMLMVLVSVVMVRVAPVMVQAPVWKVRLPVSTVLVPSVTLPLRSTGTLRVRAVLLLPESLPPVMVSLPVPSAELLPTRKTPALRAVPPLYVFAPVKVAIPVVVLVALAAPAMTVVPIVLLARRSIRVLTVNGPTPVIALPLLVTISVSIVSAKPPVAKSPPLRVTAQVSGITPAAPRVRIPLLTVIGPAQLLLVFERVNVELSMVRRPDPVLVMGLSAVMATLLELPKIVPPLAPTVMLLPNEPQASVLPLSFPPFKVMKSETSVPGIRFGEAKSAVPAVRMNLVTDPLPLLKSTMPAPALVMVPE